MAELHFLIVLNTETMQFRVTDLAESPVDSDECVWDQDDETWRRLTETEEGLYEEAWRALDDGLFVAEAALEEYA